MILAFPTYILIYYKKFDCQVFNLTFIKIKVMNKERIEWEIARLIKEDNGSITHFSYSENELRVITFNPIKNESFLLKEVTTENVEQALSDILKWLQQKKSDRNSYTVNWTKKGEHKMYNSYFCCSSVREVIDTFYYDKNEQDYIIYEIKQNPIS